MARNRQTIQDFLDFDGLVGDGFDARADDIDSGDQQRLEQEQQQWEESNDRDPSE